jgi:hypothetical protein
MKWTNARPDKDGFYWLKHYVNYSLSAMNVLVIEVVEVHRSDEEIWVMFAGTEEDLLIEHFNDDCFWYGPLEPPHFKSWHEEHPLSPEP